MWAIGDLLDEVEVAIANKQWGFADQWLYEIDASGHLTSGRERRIYDDLEKRLHRARNAAELQTSSNTVAYA